MFPCLLVYIPVMLLINNYVEDTNLPLESRNCLWPFSKALVLTKHNFVSTTNASHLHIWTTLLTRFKLDWNQLVHKKYFLVKDPMHATAKTAIFYLLEFNELSTQLRVK